MYSVINVITKTCDKIKSREEHVRFYGTDVCCAPRMLLKIGEGIEEWYVLYDEFNVINIVDENDKLLGTQIEQVLGKDDSHIHYVKFTDNYNEGTVKVNSVEITKKEYEEALKREGISYL